MLWHYCAKKNSPVKMKIKSVLANLEFFILLTLSIQIVTSVDEGGGNANNNGKEDIPNEENINKDSVNDSINVNNPKIDEGDLPDNEEEDVAFNETNRGIDDDLMIESEENETLRHRHRHRHQHHHRNGDGGQLVEGELDNLENNETLINNNQTVIEEIEIMVNESAGVKNDKTGNLKQQVSEIDLRTEMVKAQLLQKLGLSTPPKVDGPLHPLPDDFYIGENFFVSDEPDEEDENYEMEKVKTRQIFVFGNDVTNLCLRKRGAGCYSFYISEQGIHPEDVGSVELWVYKQADLNDHHIQTFVVSELSKHKRNGREYLRSRNIVKRVETRLKYGWMKIYVNRMVLRWLSKPQRNNGLAVVCKTCKRKGHKTIFGDKEGMMPFLVFYMNRRKTRARNKRAVRCLEGGDNCCHKEHLEINFRDIGWDYIMAPLSIRPNFCTGSCNGIHAAYYNHTRLLYTLQQSVMHDFTPVQPCCSPVHFRRTQSLLYSDHSGIIRKIDVPDLIIGECGCT